MDRDIFQVYEFGPFLVDAVEHRLLHNGKAIPLSPKVFDTLLVLVENSGRTLDKNELMEKLWPDSFVEESSLAQNIFQLRKALGEGPNGEQYIETIPKRGYRFAAIVRAVRQDSVEKLVVQRRSETTFVIEEEAETNNGESGRTAVALSQIQSRGAVSLRRGGLSRRFVLVSSFAGVIVLGAVAYLWQFSSTESPSGNALDMKSIAVLPFKPLDEESDIEQLRLGIADSLISRLGNLRQITVRPTGSILKYSDVDQDALAAARELRVDAVLDGTIQRVGDRLRVNVQLVRVSDGVAVWSQKFDEQFNGILAIQDLVSEQVATKLVGRLSDETRIQLARGYTRNTEAYHAYVRGRYFWNKRSEEGYIKGLEHFQRAIEIDPSYALAYSGLADCYLFLAFEGLSNIPADENFRRARAAAIRALEIDETLAEPYTTLAAIRSDHDGDWAGAERAYKEAILSNPNYPTAHHWYAWDLLTAGRSEEALSEMRKAQELDPLSLNVNTALGQIYYYTRRYDEAIEQCRKTLDLDAHHVISRIFLGMAYEQKGMLGKAVAEYKKILDRSATDAVALSASAHVYVKMQKGAEARRILAELEKTPNPRPLLIYQIAVAREALGDRGVAFGWLERVSRSQLKSLLVPLKFDPRLDGLRSDPRFKNLLNAQQGAADRNS